MSRRAPEALTGMDAAVASAGIGRRAIPIAIAAAATAVAARVAVPLPGTPVPFTLQPVAVLLAGVLLGSRAGSLSQLAYLAAGLAGLPVFAAGGGWAYLLGPTGGYLLAFPIAAWIAGFSSERITGGAGIVLGSVAGLAAIHAGGLAWLAAVSGAGEALAVGVAPFFVGDLLKVALVTVIGIGLGGRVDRLIG